MKAWNYFLVCLFSVVVLLNGLVILTDETEPLISESGFLLVMSIIGVLGYVQLIRRKKSSINLLLVFSILLTLSAFLNWSNVVDGRNTALGYSVVLLVVSLGLSFLLGWWGYLRANKELKSAEGSGLD